VIVFAIIINHKKEIPCLNKTAPVNAHTHVTGTETARPARSTTEKPAHKQTAEKTAAIGNGKKIPGKPLKYVHTNLIAKDWRSLSNFYQKVFGCKPIGPQRDLSGKWIEDLTGIENVHITGEHLLLPGYEEDGPTLEIFSYGNSVDSEKQVNAYGFSHIAFEVQCVETAAALVLKEGGSVLGKITSKDYGKKGIGTFVYARDIEGNIIELQSWNKEETAPFTRQ